MPEPRSRPRAARSAYTSVDKFSGNRTAGIFVLRGTAAGREVSMRMLFSTALLVTALVGVSASQQRPSTPDVVERPFVTNGRITMDLMAGEYRIVGGPERRIRIAWTARDPGRYRQNDVRADVNGPEAR